jgi:hypothetical protein
MGNNDKTLLALFDSISYYVHSHLIKYEIEIQLVREETKRYS